MSSKGSSFDINQVEVEDYEFAPFDSVKTEKGGVVGPDDARDFEFVDLKDHEEVQLEDNSEVIALERKRASEKNFLISPIVKYHRGMLAQEHDEKESRIEDEVQRRLKKLKEEVQQQGYQDGVEAGKREVKQEMQAQVDRKLEDLNNMVQSILSTEKEILENQKLQIYEMIKNLTKWIILRELKEDGEYVSRLLEKLISEADARNNLFIQVNKSNYEGMDEVLEQMTEKFGQLKNVRVESDPDIGEKGIVLETDNGIVNGTLEEQFNNLDKLFESVGLDGSREDS